MATKKKIQHGAQPIAVSRPTIGLLLMHLQDRAGYENALMLNLTAAAQAVDVNLVAFLGLERDLGLLENDVFQLAFSDAIAGLLISPTVLPHVDVPTMHKFFQRHAAMPMVGGSLSNSGRRIPDIPQVVADDYAGMYAVVEHLIVQHNCTRMVFVRGLRGQREAEERYRAYREALAAHAIALDAALVLQGDYSLDSGAVAMREFLTRDIAFDAVVSANDGMAIAILDVLQAAGIHVPEEVVLTGFDDIEQARNLSVPLTTVRSQFQKSSYLMLELLLQKIQGAAVPDIVTVSTELVIRRSCGCLPDVIRHAQLDSEDYVSQMAESRYASADFVPDAAPFRNGVPEDMWCAFLDDVLAVEGADFLLWYDRRLQCPEVAQTDVVVWEETLSTLRHHVLPYLVARSPDAFDAQVMLRAENLFQQARVLVGDAAVRRTRASLLVDWAHVGQLQSLGRAMTSILDMQDLAPVLDTYLPVFGIHHCHILVFPEVGALTAPLPRQGQVQLLLSYTEGVTTFYDSAPMFEPAQLLSDLFASAMVGPHVVVLPLWMHLRLLGYAILDFVPAKSWIYEQLGSEFSSALFRAQLLLQQQQAQHDVEQLLADAQRRASLLAGAAEISRATTALTNLAVLLPRAVELIRERFSLYYAGIFLVDDVQQWAVLRAGTGEAGRIMLERGHKLEMAGTSMIGTCVSTGEAQITFEAEHEAGRRKNLVLPDTRSEMALPLISGDHVIGAMTIQSTKPGAFSQEDITTLQTMADQLANAIENARLIAQMAQSRRELEIASSQYTARSWRELVERTPQKIAYRYRHLDIEAVGEPYVEAQAALRQQTSVLTNLLPDAAVSAGEGTARTGLGVPIRLRNQVLGVLDLRFEDADVPPETIELVEQIADRLAISLESARLLQETRGTANREQLLNRVTSQMRESLDVDAVLRLAATQIREVMDLSSVTIRLAAQSSKVDKGAFPGKG